MTAPAPIPDDAALLHRYCATRDPALREEAILRYVPLVHYVLGRLGFSRAQGADYEDAVSQGMLGLIEAVDHYDISFGTRFSTYATHRIRGRVLDHLRSLDWLTRGARRQARLIQQATQELWASLGRSPSDEELAAHLGMEQAALQEALANANRVIVSLDSVADADEDGEGSLHELLADDGQPNPAESLEDADLKTRLVVALRCLSEREQQILSLYYYEDLTFKEIGAVLNVTESRICQLHARAILNLRVALKEGAASPAESRASNL